MEFEDNERIHTYETSYEKRRRQREAFLSYARLKREYTRNALRLEELSGSSYLFLTERRELEKLKEYPFGEVLEQIRYLEGSKLYKEGDFIKKLERLCLPAQVVERIIDPLPDPPELVG